MSVPKWRSKSSNTAFMFIIFETQGHNEIAETPYGILAGVKEGAAFTAGEWGSEICETMKPQGEFVSSS